MKKTTLRQAALKLALLAVALLAPLGLWAQETVQIGDDASTSTQYYYPVNMYYHYSMSEQIYDADEIGMEGTITSISFYYTYNSAFSMENVTLYMKNTDKTVFESNADMEALSAADIVWNGTLEASASGWITIELTTPFVYDGSSNLMVAAYYPNYTYPGSSFKFRTTSCTGYKAITWYSDNYIPDPYNPDPSTWTGSGHTKSYHQYRTNIQLVIEPPAAGDCERPETVTVSDITPTSAQLNWEGGSTPSNGYNVELKGGEYTDWTPIYSNISQDCILTNLTANTAYQARVQVVCSSSVSSWKTASFTTPNPCAVPTDLIVSNITGTSATLSWTEGYQETSWTVKYKKSSQSWEDATEETATGTPSITLNNLDDFTSYDVRVFNCENYVSGNFTTLMECPDGVVCIGSGTATNNYYPANNYYKYSLTEQIYTADEIGDAGAILSISFYKNNTTSMVKNLDIYMMSTSVDAFTGTSDWIVPTAANLVYSGTVTFADNAWTTIDLDVPFIYDGTSNVVILFDNKTGSYSGNTSTPFLAFSASENNQGIYFYQDGSSLLDPTNPSANNSGVTTQKNIIRMVIGEPPSCLRPTGVTASNVTAHEATITWTSDADSWQIQLGEETPIDVTDVTSHTFTGLDPEETYSVIVRSLCGGTYSEWTNAVSFTTGIACPAPTGVTVSNVDGHSATVTWTEAGSATHWDVTYKLSTDDDAVYEENVTPVSTASHTLSGLNPSTAYIVKVRAACGGEDGNSQWATKNFSTTVACPAPTSITFTNVTTTSAQVGWTSNATDFVLAYKLGTDEEWTEVEHATNPYTIPGLAASTTYNVKVKAICGGDDGESDWSTTTNLVTADLCPDGKVCIGAGTATSNYLPANNYYRYSLTEQIYTAEEIGMAGAIFSLDFYKNSTMNMVKNLDIYMMSTSVDAFTATSDWIVPTAADLVYSGTVTFADNDWTTIELDVPFIYDGTSNVVILVNNKTGAYENSNTPFYVFSASSDKQTIYFYRDGSEELDLTNPSATYSGTTNQKNRIRMAIGEPPTCSKPTGLTVNYTGGTEATISWTSDASAWNMRVNGVDVNDVITNPYTLTNLDLATTYEVEVQADCGANGTSDWTSPVSFNTANCLATDMCEITITMTDAYGDGGGQIDVVDVATNTVLGTYTVPDHNEQNLEVSDTYTLEVCNGRELNFVFTATDSWSYENGWVITDINDEIISEHQGCLSSTACDAPTNGVFATYTVNCAPLTCPKPTDLTAGTPTAHTVELSWTEMGTAEQWEICVNEDEENPITADANPFTLDGLDPETEYTVKVRAYCASTDQSNWTSTVTFTTEAICLAPTNLTTSNLSINSAELSWTGDQTTYNLRYRYAQPDPTETTATIILEAHDVWEDGSGYMMLLDADATAYGTLWNAEHAILVDGSTYSSGDLPADYFAEFEYKAPEEADGSLSTTNVVVDGALSITIPAGTYDYAIFNPTPGSRFYIVADNGEVGGAEDDFVFEAGMTYHFTIARFGTGDGAALEAYPPMGDWITVENVTSPYELTSLTPNTYYQWRVQGGISAECAEGTDWSAIANFTTATLDIEANKWYAISAPRHDIGKTSESFANVTNLTTGTYDLYRYNEDAGRWENSVNDDNLFSTLEQGRGYIYRRSTDATLTFNGLSNAGDIDADVTFSCLDNDIKGFNLVGNPYPHTYSYGNLCYSLNHDGTWQAHTTYAIPVAEGVLVHYDGNIPVSFSEVLSDKSAPAALETLAFTVSNNEFRDVAYAMFNGEQKLPKIGHLNSNAPALSIPVDGIRYAIANLGSNCESFDMNFSGNDGEYTITLNSKLSNMSYLHLIDRATGNDIDLLRTPTYTFTHSSIEAIADRFLVKMSASIFDNQEGQIARFNGNGWTVQGDGNLQVFDVLGRNVMNVEVNAQSSINNSQFPGTGVYILRLGEKSQKIVVK